MKDYTTNKRYCPHLLETKLHSVQLYRQTRDISYVCRKYKVSKASLMRWNKAYDGTKESLIPKSHRPHTPHPNAHTEQEIKWITDYHRRGIPTYPWASFTVNCVRIRHILAIPDLFIVCLYVLDFARKQNLQRKSPNITSHTIHQL